MMAVPSRSKTVLIHFEGLEITRKDNASTPAPLPRPSLINRKCKFSHKHLLDFGSYTYFSNSRHLLRLGYAYGRCSFREGFKEATRRWPKCDEGYHHHHPLLLHYHYSQCWSGVGMAYLAHESDPAIAAFRLLYLQRETVEKWLNVMGNYDWRIIFTGARSLEPHSEWKL